MKTDEMNRSHTETEIAQTQNPSSPTELNLKLRFVELRARGHSLGLISQILKVPKSTLYGWNQRNREMIDRLKRIELEQLEERFVGSHQEQFSTLAKMLGCLEDTLARKVRDHARDLSINQLFWMAATLRSQVRQLRGQTVITDVPQPDAELGPTRTNSYGYLSPLWPTS
jgi:hypothetical protein